MWTVTIRDKGLHNEAITLQVEFKNGDESIVRNFAGNTKEELDSKIARQLETLEKRDANVDLVTVGEWTPPFKPVEPEKTADELAADAWLEQWNAFTAAEKAMDALKRNGITPTTDEQTAFETLKKWVADNRKPEYSRLIAGI